MRGFLSLLRTRRWDSAAWIDRFRSSENRQGLHDDRGQKVSSSCKDDSVRLAIIAPAREEQMLLDEITCWFFTESRFREKNPFTRFEFEMLDSLEDIHGEIPRFHDLEHLTICAGPRFLLQRRRRWGRCPAQDEPYQKSQARECDSEADADDQLAINQFVSFHQDISSEGYGCRACSGTPTSPSPADRIGSDNGIPFTKTSSRPIHARSSAKRSMTSEGPGEPCSRPET